MSNTVKKQQILSTALDKSLRRSLANNNRSDPYFLAHLNLVAAPGAGAWLTAIPEDETRECDTVLFKLALKRRRRLRVQAEDCVPMLRRCH